LGVLQKKLVPFTELNINLKPELEKLKENLGEDKRVTGSATDAY
jgi:hypothetical protein